MPQRPSTETIIATLNKIDSLTGLPEEDLRWLAETGEYLVFQEGDELFYPGMATEHMVFILTGSFRVMFPQGGELREMDIFEGPSVTGVLPFSRMKESKAYGKALNEVAALRLHRDRFVDLVNQSYALAERLVARMSTRIRDFTQSRLRSEKLMSLGKLSAGLAHELNNPASAIVRSVTELYSNLHQTPESFKEVITMKITPEQTDAINAIIFQKLDRLGEYEDFSLLEQENHKDDLIDWLEDNDIDQAEDIADTLVEFCFSEDDLDTIKDELDAEALGPVLRWAQRVLGMEKIVSEIKEASDRIAGLVSSIKSYTHMDQGSAKEAHPLHEGLKGTIVMLKHKLRQKQIQLDKQLDYDAPPVIMNPGELNQVWTNIIDNAIDAMDKGGVLKIRSYQLHHNICVEITDNGTGIPEEVIDRIFDPFFTTKGIGEGTGLGLEVSRRIVEDHRGRIDVTSQPGATTFVVCLPAAQK